MLLSDVLLERLSPSWRRSMMASVGPKAAGVSHDSPRAQKCTFEGPGLQSHHQNSTKRPPREEERMKIVACPAEGEGRVGRGGSGGGGVRESAQILDAPTKILNTHRTDTPHHKTTHHNGGSRTGWSRAREVPRREVHGPKNKT